MEELVDGNSSYELEENVKTLSPEIALCCLSSPEFEDHADDVRVPQIGPPIHDDEIPEVIVKGDEKVEPLVIHCNLTIPRAPKLEFVVCLEFYCPDVRVSTGSVKISNASLHLQKCLGSL